MNNRQIQQKLLDRGFDPKGVDGILGRNSIEALKQFQRRYKIPITGLADARTLAKLLGSSQASAGVPTPPWIDLALAKKGLHEKRDNSVLRNFLKLGKGTIGDPARIPWCGDFVETCMAITLPQEVFPANPYAAINWLKFGVETTPRIGALLVFHRGDPNGWEGHIGFYVGEDETHFHVLGGNQSNAVTISRIQKNRLRKGGCRAPATYALNSAARVTPAGNIEVTTNEV